MRKSELMEQALISHLTVYELLENCHEDNDYERWAKWRDTLIYLCSELSQLKKLEASIDNDRERKRAGFGEFADTLKGNCEAVF